MSRNAFGFVSSSLQPLGRQYLYFCTSKASKVAERVGLQQPLGRQYLCFCTSKASKVEQVKRVPLAHVLVGDEDAVGVFVDEVVNFPRSRRPPHLPYRIRQLIRQHTYSIRQHTSSRRPPHLPVSICQHTYSIRQHTSTSQAVPDHPTHQISPSVHLLALLVQKYKY
jgi:hypothetical protein